MCMLQRILSPSDTICESTVFHMTAHNIYANSAYYLYANSL